MTVHWPRLRYADVMVTLLAIVVLGGGSAYAATQLAKNSVGRKQLKKNAVTSAKVKNHSLRSVDFAKGQLPAGPRGPQGERGPQGTRGARGPQGTSLASHLFQADGSVNYDKFSSSLFGTEVVTLAVPSGNYLVIATVAVQTVNGVASSVQCRLINGEGGGGSEVTSGSQVARADGEVDNMTLTGGFRVTSGQSLSLQCSKDTPAASARITDANIVATSIGDVSGVPR